MDNLNPLYRTLALLLLISQLGYWYITAKKAEKEKPLTAPTTPRKILERIIFNGLETLLVLQLAGLTIFPYPANPLLELIGILLVSAGVTTCLSARKQLGTNWTHAVDFQIKSKHTLTTTGIYHLIRHPIYAGIMCTFVGSELIVNSYLVFFLFPVLLLGSYYQGKREESILIRHFGQKYKTYMHQTKMLIPYIL